MKPRRRLVASLGSAAVLVLTLAAWIAFAPVQFGGKVSYVIVNGDSMEPRLHRGDLVIVRESPSYLPGDIVTYRHPDIGPVIHRIIGRNGEHYVFKGDHNGFTDSYQPVEGEMVGTVWIHVPGLGRWLEPLKTPVNLGLLSVLAVVGLGGTFGAAHTPARRRNGRRQRPGLARGGA